MKFQHVLLWLLPLAILGQGCLPEFSLGGEDLDNQWEPGFAIPLLESTVTVDELLSDFETGGFIRTGGDNLLTVVYRAQGNSITGDNFFTLQDVQVPFLDTVLQVPSPFAPPTTINTITLKQGRYTYGVTSLETQAVNVTVTLTDLTQGGASFQRQYNLPASDGTTPVTLTDTALIADYNLSFAGGDFEARYSAVRADGQSVTLPNSYFELIDLDYSYIDGYFGTRTLPINYTISVVDLFQNWTSGNIQFEAPRLTFSFENSFGFPIRLVADSVSASTASSGDIQFQSTVLDNGINLNFPALAQVGDAAATSVVFDNTNSNIANIISAVPYEFYYDLEGDINPNNDPSVGNFITDSSRLDIDLDVELPLYGSISQFVVFDSLDFDFGEYSDLSRMDFLLNTNNGFPVDLDVQVYFMDENRNAIDSLFSVPTRILSAAQTDANGEVTTPTLSTQQFELSGSRLEALKLNAQKILVTGAFATPNGGSTPVKVLNTYQATIKLGAIIGF